MNWSIFYYQDFSMSLNPLSVIDVLNYLFELFTGEKMKEICWLDIGFQGVSSKQVRNYIRKYGVPFNQMGINIVYRNLNWSDILYGSEKYKSFLEKNMNKTILARYRGPEISFERESKKETGQNRYLPGEKYVKFFKENTEAIDIILKRDLNVDFVNTAESINIARDKYAMFQLLRKNGIDTPDTFLVSELDRVEELLDIYGSIFVKPPGGAFGRGAVSITKVSGSPVGKTSDTFWIKTKYKLDNGLESEHETKTFHTSDKKEFRDRITKILQVSSLVQPNIRTAHLEDSYGTELKWDMRMVMVFPDIYKKIISATIRAVPHDELVTNLSAGGEAYNLEKLFIKSTKLKRCFELGVRGLEKLRETSIRVSELTGLNETGIDFMLSKDDLVPYVIEANGAPEYRAGYYSGITIGEFTVCGMLQKAGFEDPLPGLKDSTFEDEELITKLFEEYNALQKISKTESS